MKTTDHRCSRAPPAGSPKVHWPKTWAAWLLTSLLMLTFVELAAPSLFDFGDARHVLIVGMIWLAAMSIMVVTHIALHSLWCLKLRHYVCAYPIVVSPILFEPLLRGFGFVWTLMLSLILAPSVVLFWCLYALMMKAAWTSPADGLLGQESKMKTSNAIFRSILAIGLAFVGIFVLHSFLVLLAEPLLLESGPSRSSHVHPSLVWSGMGAPIAVAYWGAVVHCTLLRKDAATLRNYTLGFLIFVLGFSLFYLGFVGVAIIFTIGNLFVEGFQAIPSFSVDGFVDHLVERAPYYLRTFIFPAVFLAGAPLLWWAYHVAAPRILPARLIA